MSILSSLILTVLFYCTFWTLTKHLEKKFKKKYTKILRFVLNKSYKLNIIKQ